MAGGVELIAMGVDGLSHLILDGLLQGPAGTCSGDVFEGGTDGRLGCKSEGENRMMTRGVSFLALLANRVGFEHRTQGTPLSLSRHHPQLWVIAHPALGYVRQWMLRNTQIMAVVDMARELFQPKNDTQTSMVLMRRLSTEERGIAAAGKLNYPVFMAVTNRIGHDKRGASIYRQAPNGDHVVVLRQEQVTEIDPKTGKESIRTVQVKDRVIDDELSEVAEVYREWLKKLP